MERQFRQRDQEREEQKSAECHYPVSLPVSDELYLLRKYRWLILSNQSTLRYHTDLRMDNHFHRLMNTYDYEDALFRIDHKLRDLRDLKEKYVQFHDRNAGNPIAAATELDELISFYYRCGEPMFVDFASLLSRYRDQIINSFVMVSKVGPGGLYDSRLSNGPIESLNRKIKDLKRLGRGFRSFDHFRNRFLYATRNNPVLDGTSDSVSVQYLEEDDF